MNLKNKQEIIKQYGKNEKDSGSTAVQVALMSQKISELTEHLKSNKKDLAKISSLYKNIGYFLFYFISLSIQLRKSLLAPFISK